MVSLTLNSVATPVIVNPLNVNFSNANVHMC